METEPEREEVENDFPAQAEEPPGKALRKRRSVKQRLRPFILTLIYLALAPVVIVAGIGWHYLDKNAEIDVTQLEKLRVGAEVIDRKGRLIGRVGTFNRILVERDELPDHFIDALLAAEDQRFFLHFGFDPIGTMRAAWVNYQADEIVEGGSTLTQQLARDVYGLEGQHIERKLNEIAISVRLEGEYSKDEILIRYLNRIYFGSGFYGVGAAAKGYFDKPVDQLTIGESAMLCGLIRSPSRFSPFVSHDMAIRERNQTLRRMHNTGALDAEELKKWIKSETPVSDSREQRISRGQIRFLLSRVDQEVAKRLGESSIKNHPLGEHPLGEHPLEGLTIETTIDLDLQLKAAAELDRYLLSVSLPDEVEKKKLEGALILVESGSGRVRVCIGGRDFQSSEYDRSVEMKRPTGSAFFPFVYAAAYETSALSPDSPVIDAPFDNREMGLGGEAGVLGEWSTENPANRWEGQIRADDALRYSKNAATARVGLEVGLEQVESLVRAAGVGSELRKLSGTLLGASEVTVEEMVRAYATLGNSGEVTPKLHLIREIRVSDGSPIVAMSKENSLPAFSKKTARQVKSAISSTQLAGVWEKSGTTAGYTDAWHFAFDEGLALGVWIGQDQFTTLFDGAFGGLLAKPLSDWLVHEAGVGTEGGAEIMERPDRPKPIRVIPRQNFTGVRPLIGPDPYGTLGNR